MASAPELNNLTVRQLRERCRNAGLVVGRNNQLETQNINNEKQDDSNNDEQEIDDCASPPPRKRQKLNVKSESNDNKKIGASLDSDDDDEEQDIDVQNDDSNEKKSKDETSINMNRNEIIRLNVGGIKYLTTRGTLLNFSSECGHMLSAMFSGDYLLTPNINNNEYFIDRNGKYFEYILAFLRNGNQFVDNVLPHLSKDVIVHLKQESKYFGLYNLIFDRFYARFIWKTAFFNRSGYFGQLKVLFLKRAWETFVTDLIPFDWVEHGKTFSITFSHDMVQSDDATGNTNENQESKDEKKYVYYGLTYDTEPHYDRNSNSGVQMPNVANVGYLVKQDAKRYVHIVVNFKDNWFGSQSTASQELITDQHAIRTPINYKTKECKEKLRIAVWAAEDTVPRNKWILVRIVSH